MGIYINQELLQPIVDRYAAMPAGLQLLQGKGLTSFVRSWLGTKAKESLSSRPAQCNPSTASAPEPSGGAEEEDCDDDDEEEDDRLATLAPAAVPAVAVPKVPVSPPVPALESVAASPKSPATPDPVPDASLQKSTSTSSRAGTTYTGGFATFYYQNGVAGACGKVHGDADMIAAIDGDRYGNLGAVSSQCGRRVKITNTKNQKSVTVTIADACPTCRNSNSIDLSEGAFKKIATLDEGIVPTGHIRAALSKGIEVTSVSSSGRPYRTPKGHSPSWTAKVNWQKGDALNPLSFAHLLPEVGGVVHTLGTLLEDGAYKQAIRNGDLPGLLKSLIGIGKDSNPLRSGVVAEGPRVTYESLNRDSAIRVCEEFVKSSSSAGDAPNKPRPFVYLSAEDIFRPVIPARYIETKREAERRIEEMMLLNPDYRGVYIRPSLVYHAHLRPLTTPIATVLDLSAAIHRKVPRTLPTPSNLLRSLGASTTASSSESGSSSPLESIANALTLPPIHVDQVAAAIVATLDSESAVRGVVGVNRMRELIGWKSDGESPEITLGRI
ncbi:hypothetical protein EST38_g4962 [Candolleomyces aberdarensis]|uniref:RlpA-like protein double-psi beta-barrel domain-containing protein n=1 Tax=Candolleomyces aberdarensis TaxID=2316362 RepID=A0A4Q2DLQ7_9AGAR|nr:hypothetical protein EST38_g4962 [Candolleomyces aberdarensis]